MECGSWVFFCLRRLGLLGVFVLELWVVGYEPLDFAFGRGVDVI